MQDIFKICRKNGFSKKNIMPYGKSMAKIDNGLFNPTGKLILVTAMTSNKMGIGKTTVSIGLADALNRLNQKTILALREPSMGPVFGIKGGATGGGKSEIIPSDEINLHFTGDFHAVAQANNLLSSILDNHIFFENRLNIDTNKIFFKRCLDINDRSLRDVSYCIKDKKINSGFNITAASEIMSIMCLSNSFLELKQNLGNILVALDINGKPIFAKDLNAQEAMAILLKDAFKPNAVQTKEGSLALVHLGPFANIAHGCNSIIATKTALTNAKYCVTEAGFGSDLGAEKFIDIKCRAMGKNPDAVVLVIVLEVIKQHGNGDLKAGFKNVIRHIRNIKDEFNLPVVVAINKHIDDTDLELNVVKQMCEEQGVKAVISEGFVNGGKGCVNLAKEVIELCKNKANTNYTYALSDSIETKIEKIATKLYGAKGVTYSDIARQKIELAKGLGFNHFYVNIAKTQFSFSDNKELIGAPNDFDFNITDIEIRSGAKMIVAIAGSMLLMPGLGRNSNYLSMKIKDGEKISGII